MAPVKMAILIDSGKLKCLCDVKILISPCVLDKSHLSFAYCQMVDVLDYSLS